ncbi:murein hydrolase activator EnvC [Aquitalea sp. LB_tupeE]|uniref:murein hydrolase activator EnvC family protein n=1 Tax=Aquitalea sp. LB_tupeE TaxID=2748078 RepID=UPI0015BB19FD|nr:peptidoglycan DD-metalloendopeptidase family protein [Aquitalea sp. LB_tupeE]NWK77018.1 peptidoglycan DD-metalloendopeptidase family protein [Aquitalea sp. LB_tupeE]
MKPILLLALLAGAAQAAPSSASPPLSTAPQQQNLQSVRKEIDNLKKDLAQKQAVQQEAKSAIQESEQAIAQTNQVIAKLENKQNNSAQQLADLRQQVQTTAHKLAETRQRVAQMLARQYKSGDHDAMKLMLNADDPNQTSRDMVYYQHIAKAQQQMVTQLISRQHELEALTYQLEQELARLDALSSHKSREKNALLNSKSNKLAQLNKIAGEIQAGQSRLGKLQEDEKRLTNLIAQINLEIERRRQEAIRKAAEERKARQAAALAAKKENERRRKLAENARKQGKPVPEVAKKSVPVPVEKPVAEVADGSASGKAFASLQGRMKMPVSGQLAGRFGSARSEGTSWKGVFIKTAPGQPVHAVADGNVVYADALRGFGNAVIVDHGGNYLTVYTGLSAIGKSVGSAVKAGETLGNTGALDSGESGLYFEIRHMGQPLNPQTWVR